MSYRKIVLFSNTGWYLYNFRLALAEKLREDGYQVVMVAPKDDYTVKLEELGFRLVYIKMRRNSINPFREALLLNSLRNIFQEENPNIVFNFTIKCAVYGSLVARIVGISSRVNAVAGLGTVFTSETLKAKLLLPIVKLLLRFTMSGLHSRVILQNPDDVEIFINNSIVNKNHIHLIKGSGVNANKFDRPKLVTWKITGTRRILFAARLLWSKGIQYFVDAAEELSESKNFEFLIAGEPDMGNPSSVQRFQLEEWEKQGFVTLMGHVDNMDTLLSQVDLVVLPSSYGEGVPRILIEAAASSLPLVAFDNPGSREIIIDGKNGHLVEKNNLQSLIYAIEATFSSEQHYDEMCIRSRELFMTEFEEASVISRTIDVINLTYSD